MQQMQMTNDSASADDPEALAAALMEVAALIMREVRALMRSHRGASLSVAHFRALGYVRRHPACSLTAVADHLGLSVPATSRLVDALVADGLMVRQPSAHDRRFVTLQLSPEGERIQNEARSAAMHSLAARLEPLSPQHRAIIAQALDPLRQAFPSTADADAASARTGPAAHEEYNPPGNAEDSPCPPASPP